MAYTTIDNPELHFQVKTYTANQTNGTAITLDGDEDMSPNMCWWKNRDATYDHRIIDTVRGVTKILTPNTTSAEATNSDALASFDSDGFTVNADPAGYGLNYATGNGIVAWCWKAGTTSGISGSPSITPSGYSFSQTAGFSIIAYTGNATVGATIPHGLGVAPAVIIFKNRDSSVKWAVYHHKNTSAPETDHLQLNDDGGTSDDDSILNDTAPSSSVITMKTSSSVNSSGHNFICYAFTSIKGFSKMGSYTGNGSTNGTFVYTGFKPAFVMIKRSSST